MPKKKLVKKRRLKWKSILKLLSIIALISLVIFALLQIKTKRIIIKGNNYVTDNEIIEASGYKYYPKLSLYTSETIKNNLLSLPLLASVNIKKTVLGSLIITVKENKPLFYNRNSSKLVLSDKKEITSTNLYGVPVLVNSVPNTYYERFIEKLNTIDENVLKLISEIEYDPWKSNDVLIDETRFILRMNDGNTVYVNLIHLDKLNNYIEIFASLENKKGILYLDSSSDKISFSLYS